MDPLGFSLPTPTRVLKVFLFILTTMLIIYSYTNWSLCPREKPIVMTWSSDLPMRSSHLIWHTTSAERFQLKFTKSKNQFTTKLPSLLDLRLTFKLVLLLLTSLVSTTTSDVLYQYYYSFKVLRIILEPKNFRTKFIRPYLLIQTEPL